MAITFLSQYIRIPLGLIRSANFLLLQVGSWLLVRRSWCIMQMPRYHILRLRDACQLATVMEMRNIAVPAAIIDRISAGQVAFRNLSKKCAPMRIRMRSMMPRARLLQTQDHNTALKWYFVRVHILIESLLITSDGVSTDYLHGGAGRLSRGGLAWTLVALCTTFVWLGV
jgi:hypothetical protein